MNVLVNDFSSVLCCTCVGNIAIDMSKRNGEIPLPQGWELGRDYDGKVYFIDHNSKKTTWVDPRDRFVNILNTISLNFIILGHPSKDAETCCR